MVYFRHYFFKLTAVSKKVFTKVLQYPTNRQNVSKRNTEKVYLRDESVTFLICIERQKGILSAVGTWPSLKLLSWS